MAEIVSFEEYGVAWSREMLKIWQEKVRRYKLVRTGALHESFRSQVDRTAEGQTITMKFAKYGAYMAVGVGYGFKKYYSNRIPGSATEFKVHSLGVRPNHGDLPFMGKDFRAEHGLDKPGKVGPAWGGYETSGKPRQRRDWYSRKLYMSIMNMVEDLARITGEEAVNVICNALGDVRDAV